MRPTSRAPIAVDRQSNLTGDPAEIVAGVDADRSPLLAAILDGLADWRADALCREFDHDLWFPAQRESTRPALDICGRCPVRIECLDEALADPDLDHGIRGGMTAAARKQRRKANATTTDTTEETET